MARQAIVSEIEALETLIEWSSKNLMAISIKGELEAQKLADYLYALEEQGLLQYETGRTA